MRLLSCVAASLNRGAFRADFLVVEEVCTYEAHPDNPDWTIYKQKATIKGTAPLFSSSFESHGLSRLQQQAKDGLLVMEKLCEDFAHEAINEIEMLVNDVETGFSGAFHSLFSTKTERQDKSTSTDETPGVSPISSRLSATLTTSAR